MSDAAPCCSGCSRLRWVPSRSSSSPPRTAGWRRTSRSCTGLARSRARIGNSSDTSGVWRSTVRATSLCSIVSWRLRSCSWWVRTGDLSGNWVDRVKVRASSATRAPWRSSPTDESRSWMSAAAATTSSPRTANSSAWCVLPSPLALPASDVSWSSPDRMRSLACPRWQPPGRSRGRRFAPPSGSPRHTRSNARSCRARRPGRTRSRKHGCPRSTSAIWTIQT